MSYFFRNVRIETFIQRCFYNLYIRNKKWKRFKSTISKIIKFDLKNVMQRSIDEDINWFTLFKVAKNFKEVFIKIL